MHSESRNLFHSTTSHSPSSPSLAEQVFANETIHDCVRAHLCNILSAICMKDEQARAEMHSEAAVAVPIKIPDTMTFSLCCRAFPLFAIARGTRVCWRGMRAVAVVDIVQRGHIKTGICRKGAELRDERFVSLRRTAEHP